MEPCGLSYLPQPFHLSSPSALWEAIDIHQHVLLTYLSNMPEQKGIARGTISIMERMAPWGSDSAILRAFFAVNWSKSAKYNRTHCVGCYTP